MYMKTMVQKTANGYVKKYVLINKDGKTMGVYSDIKLAQEALKGN